MDSELLSVVVRFHDCSRLYELERALLSLLMQTYAPLEVILVTQRLSKADLMLVKNCVSALQEIEPQYKVTICNFEAVTPVDARSALLNLGIKKSRGQYLAFLDYDDAMQPHAYELLIAAIKQKQVAIAFGGIAVKVVSIEDDYCLTRFRKEVFTKPLKLADFLEDNHCPIHSFVLDKRAVEPQLLHFEEDVQRAEDYQFLLRICAQHSSDFSAKKVAIGDYYLKDDQSNTVVTTEAHPKNSTAIWQKAADDIDAERRTILLSPEVLADLGENRLAGPISIYAYLENHRAYLKQNRRGEASGPAHQSVDSSNN